MRRKYYNLSTNY